MTSSAGWTATRPSTTPTSPKPAANATSASRKPTFRVCMANCWSGATNAARSVAACYDCHGHHDVRPPSNPASHLSKTNILATCRQCHPGATIGFTEFKPHANPLDAKHYPLLHAVFLGMTGLLLGTFAFFGLHTLLWLVRAGWLYLHDSKKFREAKIKTQVDDEWFTRFVPFERFLHFLVVTSFLLLVITGMPLKFY